MFVYKKEKPSCSPKVCIFSSTNERYKSELYSPATVACGGRGVHAKLKKKKQIGERGSTYNGFSSQKTFLQS